MNWVAVAAIASCAGVAVNFGILVKLGYFAGRMVEKVETHDREIAELREAVNNTRGAFAAHA